MKDIKFKDKIAQGINDLFYIWKREFQTTFRDQGVLIFFILVPLGYPLLYSFIYDNEVVREVPAVVVDDSHSSLSREYLRKVDATPDIQIVAYCADMEEAKQMLKNRLAYGIIYIPSDFSDNIAKGKQTQVRPDPLTLTTHRVFFIFFLNLLLLCKGAQTHLAYAKQALWC